MTDKNQQNKDAAHSPASQTAAEQSAVSAPQVVSGLGYPAGRNEVSPQSTGWQASGPNSTAPGALGTLEKVANSEKVSRGTSE